jgi:hypothetical protein
MARPDAWLKEVARTPHLMKLTYRVAIRMAYHADFDSGRNCRPGAKRIADEIGLDRSNKNHVDQVGDCIRELERHGLLSKYHQSRGNGDANGYCLTTPTVQLAKAQTATPLPQCDFRYDDGAGPQCGHQGANPTVAPNGRQVRFCDRHMSEYEEWKRRAAA